MKAIQVKMLAATDTKGTRIKAWTYGGNQITVGFDHERNEGENMANAAWALAKKLEWVGDFRGGTLPNGDMCFVCGDDYFFMEC